MAVGQKYPQYEHKLNSDLLSDFVFRSCLEKRNRKLDVILWKEFLLQTGMYKTLDESALKYQEGDK